MRLLDLYCGAGGASAGYVKAGFEVVGVDLNPQPNYPYEFIQGDAIDFGFWNYTDFDAIHASPPCQRYSRMQNIHKNWDKHPDLVAPTRDLLRSTGLPYVIENVEGSPLINPLMLCGSMFQLPIKRHRLFESNFPLPILMPACDHTNMYDPYHGGEQARGEREKLSAAMGIDWFMTRPEVREAIPPVYTQYIGEILMCYLKNDTSGQALTSLPPHTHTNIDLILREDK